MTTYPTRLDVFDLRQWGTIQFTQWMHGAGLNFTPETVSAVAFHVPPGSFAIDIGAYTGDTALPMALATGKDGKVLAFEPGRAALPILFQNVWQNQLLQIDIAPLAVTVKPGRYTFHYVDPGYINGGYSTSLAGGLEVTGNSYPLQVRGVSLSAYVIEYYADWLPKLSYVKIDTEGYDKDLLEANADFFMQYKPVICVEIYPFLNEQERRQLKDAISAIGYVYDEPDDVFFLPPPAIKDIVCRPKS